MSAVVEARLDVATGNHHTAINGRQDTAHCRSGDLVIEDLLLIGPNCKYISNRQSEI
jgi:hypothetical protein